MKLADYFGELIFATIVLMAITFFGFVMFQAMMGDSYEEKKYKKQYASMPDNIEIIVNTGDLREQDIYGAIQKANERFPEFGVVVGEPKLVGEDSDGHKIYAITIKKDSKWPSNNMKPITIKEEDELK